MKQIYMSKKNGTGYEIRAKEYRKDKTGAN